MAKPIAFTKPTRDPKQELLAKLEQAPAEHAAALLDGYELLQQLHDSGVLTTIRGVLTAGDKLIETAAGEANTPQAIRAIRNITLLAQMIASIDPEVLQGTCAAVSQTFGDARKIAHEPPSLFALLGTFLNRDLRRGMALLNSLLKNLAYQLKIRTAENPKK